MKLMVSGHREEKLISYDIRWLRNALTELVFEANYSWGFSLGMSGMASGIDLWFCHSCVEADMPYVACVPFEEQGGLMSAETAAERENLIGAAIEVRKVRNRHMVESCDGAVVVWDGNKGGTHNCFQQLLEARKPVWWIIPQNKKIVEV